MSANRLTLNRLLHKSRGFSYVHQTPVQAQKEPINNEEENPVRFVDTVVPLVSLLKGPSSSSFQNFTSLQVNGVSPLLLDVNGALKNLNIFSAAKAIEPIKVQRKVSTVEAGVQTDQSDDAGKTALENFDKMTWELENMVGEEMKKEGCVEEAVKRFFSAASNGNVCAMQNLADCLFTGDGVTEDKREAVRFYRQASELGHAPSMYSLARCFLLGEGITACAEKSKKWMFRAANAGSTDAAFYLIVFNFRNGCPDRARNFIRTAARDSDLRREMRGWVDDECLPDACIDVLKSELQLE